jgi:hypothetical protein
MDVERYQLQSYRFKSFCNTLKLSLFMFEIVALRNGHFDVLCSAKYRNGENSASNPNFNKYF